MRSVVGRGLLVISFLIAAALTIAGVIAQLSTPGAQVPVVEGILFLILLGWVHWQYLSRQKDSPAYQQHLSDIKTFARSVRDSALFLSFQGGRAEATNQINLSSPRAKDFSSHFPDLAAQLGQWNQLADGWNTEVVRFQGLCHKEAEKATNGTDSNLPNLLQVIGLREVEPAAITWRVEDSRLEASWQLDFDKQPAWSPIITRDLSIGSMERVWTALQSFPYLAPVAEWRNRRIAHDGLRPRLLDALEHAEIGVELKGRCANCPP